MKPYYDDHAVTMYHADCVETMRGMDEASVDAIVTDPPYGLEFMGKEWDKFSRTSEWGNGWAKGPDWRGRARTRPGRLTMRSRHETCQTCRRQRHEHDDTACATPEWTWEMHEPTQLRSFQAWNETWAREALRVLKPGGHLLAFGGTRTYHRLACAVEDAGFEIRDTLAWMYGSGFPKSRNIGGGWGTALKPAYEPVVLARKPLSERNVAANVLAHGTGAINVDACRIETGERPSIVGDRRDGEGVYRDGLQGSRATGTTLLGRWPANVVLDEEAARLLDEEAARLLDGQSGERAGHGVERSCRRGATSGTGIGYKQDVGPHESSTGYGDTGGASRFFYTAKASRRERGAGNDHPTVKPVALMVWLIRLVTPPGGVVLDPFMGSGTTVLAAKEHGFHAIGIEQDEHYCEIAARRCSQDVLAA